MMKKYYLTKSQSLKLSGQNMLSRHFKRQKNIAEKAYRASYKASDAPESRLE